MKKAVLTATFSLLFVAVLCSCAYADQLYQTSRFEFHLPDDWQYNVPSDTYSSCYRYDKSGALLEAFLVYESAKKWPETSLGLAESLYNYFGLEKLERWEEIEINGQKTVLVDCSKNDRHYGYLTAYKVGSYRANIFYMFAEGYEDKNEFINAVGTIKQRAQEEIDYFRFGNAMVKYKGHRVWKVRNNYYLLLDFTWKNVGNNADTFVVNVDVTTYQDGIELQTGYFFGKDEGTKIMPGKELPVTVAFNLRSQTGEIKVIVDKLMDYTNEWPYRQYSFDLE